MFATLSPDGRKVAYVCERTVFVESLDSGHITRLSSRGSDTIINGTSDWVNEEEFDLRNGLRWSPDSKYVAYWQFDTSGVREYSLINNTDSLYPAITSYAYPKAGETNSACRIGIVSVKGGKTHWFHVKLSDAVGNPVNEVNYCGSAPWPEYPNGGGASLELRNPWADNTKPEACKHPFCDPILQIFRIRKKLNLARLLECY